MQSGGDYAEVRLSLEARVQALLDVHGT